MCREIALSDVRSALLDDCHGDDEPVDLDELLAEADGFGNAMLPHVADHAKRAKWLMAASDEEAAMLHKALAADTSRAAV